MGIAENMLRSLAERDLSGDASSVKATFSSWDTCMAKAYCKWPVIVGIIIGSLIILGVLGCLISCICCGYQCCRGCCGCCYDCCACGKSRNNRGGTSKYADPPQPYYQQPPPPEPMNYGYRQPTAASASLASTPAPPAYRGPQTASFDQPSKAAIVNEDALPSMPTWADAQTRHVEEEHEEVEMDDLKGLRDHSKSPMAAPVPGGFSRGTLKGGYTQVPGSYPSPQPSPHPVYNDGLSPSGGVGGYSDHQDGYVNEEQGGYYGAHTDTHNFNQHPQSPGYGATPAGFSPRAPPAPYRGFDNQSPRPRVPNFSAPGGAYGQVPPARSPPPGMGMGAGAGYSPYDQQHRQLTHSPPPVGMQPSMQPSSMGAGYSPYDNNNNNYHRHQQSQSQSQYDYGHPHTQSPPPQPLTIPQQQPSPPPAPGQYRAFSPQIQTPASLQPAVAPTTTSTSFLDGHQDPEQAANSEDRPPSLLMAGRRPAPNSYRAV